MLGARISSHQQRPGRAAGKSFAGRTARPRPPIAAQSISPSTQTRPTSSTGGRIALSSSCRLLRTPLPSLPKRRYRCPCLRLALRRASPVYLLPAQACVLIKRFAIPCRDVRSVFSLPAPSSTPGPSLPKAPTTERARKPEGMSRELYSLIGTSTPTLVAQLAKPRLKQKPNLGGGGRVKWYVPHFGWSQEFILRCNSI